MRVGICCAPANPTCPGQCVRSRGPSPDWNGTSRYAITRSDGIDSSQLVEGLARTASIVCDCSKCLGWHIRNTADASTLELVENENNFATALTEGDSNFEM